MYVCHCAVSLVTAPKERKGTEEEKAEGRERQAVLTETGAGVGGGGGGGEERWEIFFSLRTFASYSDP